MQAQARFHTLSDAAFPRAGVLHNALLIVGFAVFTAVAAQISFSPPSWYASAFSSIGFPISGTPVPITGQTLAVALTGAALGSRRGILSMLLYMSAGIVGLPVFAGAVGQVTSGEFALGSTGGSLWGETPFWALASFGYIVGFVAASATIGWLAERGWDRTVPRTAFAMLVGSVVIYLFGLPWLMFSLDATVSQTLNWGLWPFVPGDTFKLLLAAGVLPSAWIYIRRRR